MFLNCILLLIFKFSKFIVFFEFEVWKFIEGSVKKSCFFDLMFILLVFSCIDVLFFVIIKMINLFFVDGVFVDVWKCVFVKLLFKKVGFDLFFSNYRFVSNLLYILKFIEKVVYN